MGIKQKLSNFYQRGKVKKKEEPRQIQEQPGVRQSATDFFKKVPVFSQAIETGKISRGEVPREMTSKLDYAPDTRTPEQIKAGYKQKIGGIEQERLGYEQERQDYLALPERNRHVVKVGDKYVVTTYRAGLSPQVQTFNEKEWRVLLGLPSGIIETSKLEEGQQLQTLAKEQIAKKREWEETPATEEVVAKDLLEFGTGLTAEEGAVIEAQEKGSRGYPEGNTLTPYLADQIGGFAKTFIGGIASINTPGFVDLYYDTYDANLKEMVSNAGGVRKSLMTGLSTQASEAAMGRISKFQWQANVEFVKANLETMESELQRVRQDSYAKEYMDAENELVRIRTFKEVYLPVLEAKVASGDVSPIILPADVTSDVALTDADNQAILDMFQ